MRGDHSAKQIIVFWLFILLVQNRRSLFCFYCAEEAVKKVQWTGEESWQTKLQRHTNCCLICWCLETLQKAAAEAGTVLQLTCRKIIQRGHCQLHSTDESTAEVTIWKGKTSTLDNVWGFWYISTFDCCGNRQMQVTLPSYHKEVRQSKQIWNSDC